MKTQNATFTLWMMVLIASFAISCTKEGDVGPRGEQGEDGTRIYNGATAPASDLGHAGDFYFRTSNADFYGPKTDAGWGTPVNLRGATGAAGPQGPNGATGPQGPSGAAGSRIHRGTAVPAGSLGAAGDFYFRTTTADFYGPKTGTNWGTPINLKGVKGDDGSRIFSGTTVPATSLGAAGDFYFRTTTGDFYGPKTAAGWGSPISLRGATGATGPQGPGGATGPQGPAGTAGSRIHSGTGVPTAGLGAVGDLYLRTSNATLYGPKTASGWGAPISLRGPAGPQGPQGPPGTANVIYSDWIPTPCTDCVDFDISAPRLTQAILDRGQISVYRRFTSHGTVFNEQIAGTYLTYGIYYWAVVGQIQIRTMDYGLGNEAGEAFRYVLIPGGVQAHQRVDLRDFDQVKAAFNIPD